MEATSGDAPTCSAGRRATRATLVGYLTQAFSLYPDLSVAENLRYVGELRRVPRPEIARARAALPRRCSGWSASPTGWPAGSAAA